MSNLYSYVFQFSLNLAIFFFTINSFKSKGLCGALFCVATMRMGKLKIFSYYKYF